MIEEWYGSDITLSCYFALFGIGISVSGSSTMYEHKSYIRRAL